MNKEMRLRSDVFSIWDHPPDFRPVFLLARPLPPVLPICPSLVPMTSFAGVLSLVRYMLQVGDRSGRPKRLPDFEEVAVTSWVWGLAIQGP